MAREFELPFRVVASGVAEITQDTSRDREQRVDAALSVQIGDLPDAPLFGHVTWEGRTGGVPAGEVQNYLDQTEPGTQALVTEGVPDLTPGSVTDRLEITVPDDGQES